MKIINILTLVLISMAAVSCGQKEVAKSLSPETTKIEGNMGEYYELVEGDYSISEYWSSLEFDVKCIKETPEVSYSKLGIGYEIFDEDGNVLAKKNATMEPFDPFSSYEFLYLKEGEIGKVKVVLKDYPEKFHGAKTFKITIDARESEESDNDGAEEEGVTEETSASTSNNWDKILDEYEQYCDKVASLSKKAMSGDVSALTEYSSLVEKAESLSNKLENAEADLTPAQVQRLNKISAKFAQSMM